jgi:tRNA (Thr-GGU) A37 N-methylase
MALSLWRRFSKELLIERRPDAQRLKRKINPTLGIYTTRPDHAPNPVRSRKVEEHRTDSEGEITAQIVDPMVGDPLNTIAGCGS